MKILMLTPDFPPNVFGGIGSHVKNLSKELSEAGHKVTVVIARFGRYEQYFHHKEADLEIYNFPIYQQSYNFSAGYWGFEFMEMNKQLLIQLTESPLKIQDYDIIHLHDYYHSLVATSLKEQYNIPIVCTVHSMSITKPEGHLIESLRRYTIINSNEVIAVSQELKLDIEKIYKLRKDIKVVTNGIEVVNSVESLARANFQNDLTKKKITFSGRLVEIKGCHYLIQALSDVDSDYELHIMGEGPMESKLKELVSKLNLGDRVIFHGLISHNEVLENIRTSSLHVVPSTAEPFGLSLVEAMAEGVPVICTDVGGMKNIVKDQWNGLKVVPESSLALSIAINKLLANKESAIKYANNAMEFVTQNRWSDKTQEVLIIYNKAFNDSLS